MADMIERRRSTRVELPVHENVTLELRHRVQVLDISETGALLGCDAAVTVGTRGKLRAGVAANIFTAQVDVKRHHPRPPVRSKVAIGTAFGSMDERSRRFLDDFLQRGKK